MPEQSRVVYESICSPPILTLVGSPGVAVSKSADKQAEFDKGEGPVSSHKSWSVRLVVSCRMQNAVR